MEVDFTNLVIVLQWLTGAGAAVVTGIIMSWVAENFKWWHTLPRMAKFIIPPVLCAVIAVVSVLALEQKEFIQAIGPWFAIVSGAILQYFGTQAGYMAAKTRGYGVVQPLGRE